MVIVLLVDLGLAAAGAVLLSKGLDDDSRAEPAPTEKKTEGPATSPAATAVTPAAEAPAAEPAPPAPMIAAAPAPASSVPAARKDTVKQRERGQTQLSQHSPKKVGKVVSVPSSAKPRDATAAQPAKRSSDAPVTRPSETSASSEPRPVTAVPTEPQDPYEVPDTAREIDHVAGRSKAAFDRCASNFGAAHGTIQIAFQVTPDGRIANAAAVENSTGNTDLANCLVTVVSSWRVSAHQGAAINMVRPFTYP